MNEPEPKRRGWRRKRTWVAVALWLALPPLYPLSTVPLYYTYGRGWTSRTVLDSVARPFYLPAAHALDAIPGKFQGRPVGDWWRLMNMTAHDAGERHAASD